MLHSYRKSVITLLICLYSQTIFGVDTPKTPTVSYKSDFEKESSEQKSFWRSHRKKIILGAVTVATLGSVGGILAATLPASSEPATQPPEFIDSDNSTNVQKTNFRSSFYYNHYYYYNSYSYTQRRRPKITSFRNVCTKVACAVTYNREGQGHFSSRTIEIPDDHDIAQEEDDVERRFIDQWKRFNPIEVITSERGWSPEDFQLTGASCFCYTSRSRGESASSSKEQETINFENELACSLETFQNGQRITVTDRVISENDDTNGLVNDLRDFYFQALERFGNNASHTHIKGCTRLVGNSRKHGGKSCFSYDDFGFQKVGNEIQAIPLKDLRVGDFILNKEGQEVSVISIAHKDPNAYGDFFKFFIIGLDNKTKSSSFSITAQHKVIAQDCETNESQEIFAEHLAQLVMRSSQPVCVIEMDLNTMKPRKLIIIGVENNYEQGVLHLTTEDGSLLTASAENPDLALQSSSVAYIDVAPQNFANIMSWLTFLGLEKEEVDGSRQVPNWVSNLIEERG